MHRHSLGRLATWLSVGMATPLAVAAGTGGTAAPGAETAWPEHPRLLARPADWEALVARCKVEPLLNTFVETLCAQARKVAKQPLPERQLQGRRLLGVSREFERRVLLTAFAWRVTGDRAFADSALANMQAVSAFSDWNPSHFLDVAEMTAGLAVGYDWLYADLTPAQRAVFRQAIVDKGLKPGLPTEGNWWWGGHNNWNQVCIAGLALGALAVAEDEPALSREFLAKARAHIGNGLAPYQPDGVYPEGPTYWDYGTSFQILLIEALQTALGGDWGLVAAPGFRNSADFYAHASGPTGACFNYADCGVRPGLALPLFALARRLERPELLAGESEKLIAVAKGQSGAGRLGPLLAFWWPATPASATGTARRELPLFWSGQGPNSVAMWRSAWGDPKAFHFAIKGGGAAVNHGHMDGGSFVLDAGGVRWAEDLGMQDYHGIEARGLHLWDSAQGSDRWRIFRLGSSSHNTVTINGALHNAKGLAKLVSATVEGAVLDLAPIFLPGTVTKAERRVKVDTGSVTLTDELAGLKPGTPVRWALMTAADITVAGADATLTKDGQQLQVRFEAAGVQLAVQSAEKPPADFDAPNPGRRQLLATVTADAAGTARIVVHLAVPR